MALDPISRSSSCPNAVMISPHGRARSTSPPGFVWRQVTRYRGGKVLSSRTRRSGSRAASLLRLAAVTIGRTDTALGAFYRRLSARAGKSKAVTATARKIAVLFYNALRHGMDYVDPGASYYETRYRERVVKNLHRRAKALGFILQAAEMPAAEQAVS